MIWKVKSSKA